MNAGQALRALCEFWERRDADAVARLFAEDGRYEDPLFEQTPVGPDEIRAACAPAIAELTEIRIPLRVSLATDEVILAEAEFLSTTADGSKLDFPLVMVVEVKDGLIVRLTEYFDTAPLT